MGGKMNPWHDVLTGPTAPRRVNAVVEVTKGSKSRYQLDPDTGLYRLEYILHGAEKFPTNFGIVPRTLGRGGAPLSIFILASEPILPMTLVNVKPIGGIEAAPGEREDKIIAVFEKDPQYDSVLCMDEVPRSLLEQIKTAFRSHEEFGKEKALDIIRRTILAYRKRYERTVPTNKQSALGDSPLRKPSKASLH
jgi:inorganic pyrophosphatase